MNNPDTFQIASTGGTASALAMATPQFNFLTMQPLAPPAPAIRTVNPGHPAPDTSVIVGPGGSTGTSWPFNDYNMMNDPEGNLASLPPIYTEDGAGGQGGDPFAFVSGKDDNAGAGYANAGAGMTAQQDILMAVGDPVYIAGAQQLQNSNLAAAAEDGIQDLAQISTKINWAELTYDPNADVAQGFKELAQSYGAQCLATAAGTGACSYAAMKFVISGSSNPDVTAGKAAFAAVQCGLGAIVTFGRCTLAAAQTPDAAENAALSVMYHGIFMDMKNYAPPNGNGGVDGGDAVHAFASSGSTSFDATMGGRLNFLAGNTYNSTTGGVNVVHA